MHVFRRVNGNTIPCTKPESKSMTVPTGTDMHTEINFVPGAVNPVNGNVFCIVS